MGISKEKKRQLGMDHGTAAHRLRMDLLFAYIVAAGHVCHRCGGTLLREDWSIEHKKPWLHSEDPVGHFFDPDNIAFSHKACNYSARRCPSNYARTADSSLTKKPKSCSKISKEQRRSASGSGSLIASLTSASSA